MKNILRYRDFLKESFGTETIDMRFPWSEGIKSLAESIIAKVGELKSEYNWEKHYNSDGFELDIKDRSQSKINFDELSKKYDIGEENLYNYWYTFLGEQLEMNAEDIIENSQNFANYSVEGRSGGWLVLIPEEDIFDNPESIVDNYLEDLNYATEDLSDNSIDLWKLSKEESRGFGFLSKLDVNDEEELEEVGRIKEAEYTAEETKESLESLMNELNEIGEELESIKERINNFWEKSGELFEEELKYLSGSD